MNPRPGWSFSRRALMRWFWSRKLEAACLADPDQAPELEEWFLEQVEPLAA